MSIAKSKILKGDLVAFADSYIMVPLDIQGTTIAMPIDIQGQTITIDVNITNATINVNITNSTITVVVSGNVNIIIADQYTALRLRNIWETEAGRSKTFHGEIESKGSVEGIYEQTIFSYTVPAGKTLYIESINFNLEPRTISSMDNVYGSGASYYLECIGSPDTIFLVYKGTTVINKIVLNGNKPSDTFTPITPLKFLENEVFKITCYSAGYGTWAVVTANGYEI
jgi:hypothetical protein